jgi:hypothetical protein
MRVIFNDGGRKAAGYRGTVGDCAIRAWAIAADLPYQEVYRRMTKIQGFTVRNGVYKQNSRAFARELEWVWIPLMHVGAGARVTTRSPILGTIHRGVVKVSKHLFAVLDGDCHDNHDPTRGGSRCVYGVWMKPDDPAFESLKKLSEEIAREARGSR